MSKQERGRGSHSIEVDEKTRERYDRKKAGIHHVPPFGKGKRRTVGESPHNCPVCGRTYIPDKQSTRLPGNGHILINLGDLCIKGGDDWLRAYYHDREVVVCDE